MPNPALDTVIDLVRAATQLEFEHSLIEEPGWNIDAIRLNTEQIHESGFRDPLFDIGIIGEPNYARVFSDQISTQAALCNRFKTCFP